MKDSQTKERFVELRAQGKSFAAIAEELDVSKPTLIDWSHDMQLEIANLQAMNDEALRERYRLTKKHRLQRLAMQLEVIEHEIAKRDLSDLPTDKLYNILLKLAGELREENDVVKLRQSGISVLDLEATSSWEG